MRLLFVHSGSDLYGASRSLLRLSKRLVQDGHQVLAILPQDGPLKNELLNGGADVIIDTHLAIISREQLKGRLNKSLFGFKIIRSILRLHKQIKINNPDIVHTMTAVIPASGIASKLAQKPNIWHVRETFVEFPGLWKYYQNFIRSYSSQIICVSTPVAKQFNQWGKDERIQVIHNGFPLEEFQPVEPERINRFREQFSLPKENILIGVVGRIKFHRKGQEIFIRAAALLKDKYQNVKFLCIGSPFPGNEEHLEQLIQLISSLGMEKQVVYTGDVADIKAAIASLDILVLPSVQPEPFGGVVIEAMALHKCVIATNVGGSIEQVENHYTGLLVKPGNETMLASAMDQLLCNESLRVSMGEHGFQRYLELFEFEVFYKKILDVYHAEIRRS